MTIPTDGPEPAGFGNCGECAYRRTGTAAICVTCARERLQELAPRRCLTCDQALPACGHCGNPLCGRAVERRGWDHIWAISMRSGPLKRAISAYKYHDKTGWGWIFARILVGYLELHEEAFVDYELIIPMPTFVGTGGRSWDHTATVIQYAAIEGPGWPFALDVMRKTAATPAMVGLSFAQRAVMAETQLRGALEVIRPAAVAGRGVLVFDDVFTGGLTLREVALKLRAAGASAVAGIVLARQPY